MSLVIPYQRRLIYRQSMAGLVTLAERVEDALKGRNPLTPAELNTLVQRSGTTDLPRNLDYLTRTKEKMEKDYLDKLASSAPGSLSCFIEYMTPEEIPAPHHEFLCNHMHRVADGDAPRSTISMPPGHAKTKICTRYFAAWYLGNNSNKKFLQAGHSQKFAEEEFGKYVRDIVADQKFLNVFPGIGLHPGSRSIGNWRLAGKRGGYVTKGVGQKIAGYRGNIGGCDDLIGSREDAESPTIRNKTIRWLFADFLTRLLPKSSLFVIATRWHPDDVIGYIIKLNKEGRGIPWEIINLNGLIETEKEAADDPMKRKVGEALWGDYYTVSSLLELKATLPSSDWWSLYKGSPIIAGGNIVKSHWYQRYDDLPKDTVANGSILERKVRRVTLSVDCAAKATQRSNYTVLEVWLETLAGGHYLQEVIRKKVAYHEMEKLIDDTAARVGASAILVEDMGMGSTYITNRQGKAPAPIIPAKPGTRSKEFRFDGVLPMIQAGEVYLPRMAPWLADFEKETLDFPSGDEDDQVDAMSQYLEYARKKRSYGTKKLGGTDHRR